MRRLQLAAMEFLKSTAKNACLEDLQEDPPRGSHISVVGGDLSAHHARFAEYREHFGQIRAQGCHFFILP